MTMNIYEKNVSKYNVDFPISALTYKDNLTQKEVSSIVIQKVKKALKSSAVGYLLTQGLSRVEAAQEWKLNKRGRWACMGFSLCK